MDTRTIHVSFQFDDCLGRVSGRSVLFLNEPVGELNANDTGGIRDGKFALDKWGVVVSIIVSSVALTVTFGLITCILSHYRAGAAAENGGTASDPNNAALTPTSAPMLSVVSAGATAGVGGMERLRGGRTAARDLAAAREQQVRLHALRTDLAVNLPPSIAMPDGEDHPYSNARIHIRDAEQEAEIYQKCIRPPPNRTVLESESPPPYRSSSAGLLGSSSSSSSSSADWTMGGMSNAPLVERCHSMSSTTRRSDATSNQKTDLLQRTVKIFTGKRTAPQAPSPAPTLPVVVVPSRRRPPEQNPPPTNHRPSRGGV
ncbi:protein TMEPAI-like isoform X3 [Coccinella septempunctata]|uniref:protein TMEPAI-like isoform X3 n=1 Tax=Coccinella septempunctata TaxID=41139 RepID=UPI001D06FFDF|nr:protein TMEPAI-like isoform X3 [Coccinella septempunctata]